MFNLKRSATEQSSNAVDSNSALPNNYGGVRTLKKDFDDFKAGKNTEDFTPPATQIASPQKTAQPEIGYPSQNIPQMPSTSQTEPQVAQMNFPRIPTEDNTHAELAALPNKNFPENSKTSPTPGIPNPFGSDSFYQQQTPFENVGEELNKQVKASSKRSSGKAGLILAIILILLLAGGGFYYWWFYMKNQSATENTGTSQKTSSPAPTPPANTSSSASSTSVTNQQASSSSDSKFKQWTIDLSSDKISTKLAIKRYINDFVSSAADNDLIEVKLVSSDGKSVEVNKFEDLFDFQLPTSISGSVTSDYSIFVKKESGLARMGAAFKLPQTTGISDLLKNDEAAMTTNLNSFYLDTTLSEAVPLFSSSKYKSADIRYFNFPSPADTSLDYTVISGQTNNYFIFATSRDTLRSILDYMSVN